jgi:signal transduction histidine kinase
VSRRSRERLRQLVDVAIPIVVTAVLVGVVLDPNVEPGPLKALGLALAVVQGVALWWRRAYPERVMAIALAGGLAIQLIAADGVLPWAGLVALGSLASLRPPRISLPALGGLLAVSALNAFTASAADTGFALVVTLVAWALGEIVRQRRVAFEDVARRAAGEEQARIARELHDVLAHTVSVIVVQAGAANEVFDSRPEEARNALRSIEAAGRDALQELRALLAGVRSDPAAAPQPGLERLDELAEPLRAAGLDVAVRWEGADRTLPAGVGLSAYRIVQEALTNTLRHAHATSVQVTVRVEPEALELDVLDDGHDNGTGAPGGGRGLAGMRERATILGGTFEAGPVRGGGYRVHARLPVEAVP